MNATILLIVVFLNAQPATSTTPAVPAHIETQAIVAPNTDQCETVGPIILSRLAQDPNVNHAGYACIPVVNPNDQKT